ncbi:hypothetical protein SAMN04487955_106166 [Halomonas korlensis]|uniref:Uncharacterized protein n=1 Tax=Halomonas korlensis TaxID=463301 RepID=A0A1I7IB06_9GAMM|nr:hypothetical protein SAMN04487955_106166 [Halomonas korlensis]
MYAAPGDDRTYAEAGAVVMQWITVVALVHDHVPTALARTSPITGQMYLLKQTDELM